MLTNTLFLLQPSMSSSSSELNANQSSVPLYSTVKLSFWIRLPSSKPQGGHYWLVTTASKKATATQQTRSENETKTYCSAPGIIISKPLSLYRSSGNRLPPSTPL